MAPKKKTAAATTGATTTISASELADLRRRAGAPGTDIEEIAKRPYRAVITAKDGQALCYPPPEGPLTIGGQHPDDYFGVDDNGVATKNAE